MNREKINGSALMNRYVYPALFNTVVCLTTFAVPEDPEAHGTLLKLPGLLVPGLDHVFGQVGQAGCVEAVALWTGPSDELVEEGDGLLAGILAFVLHHAGLEETDGFFILGRFKAAYLHF